MATPTPNLGLIMPDMSDEVDQTIPDLATSLSKIDTVVGGNSNGLTALKADVVQERINVKSSPYLAYGDDIHDDLDAIQNAINSSPNGGVVYLPAGTYRVRTNINVPSNITLKGAGWTNTFIKPLNSAVIATNTGVVQSKDFLPDRNVWNYYSPYPVGLHMGIGIEDLTIDGNRASQTTGNGLCLYGGKWSIHRVAVINTAEHGIWTECGVTGSSTIGNDLEDFINMHESTADQVFICNTNKHGWNFRGANDSYIDNVQIKSTGWSGFSFPTGSTFANGGLKVGTLHAYGTNMAGDDPTGYSIDLQSTLMGDRIYVDSPPKQGMRLGSANHINRVYIAFRNPTASGAYWGVVCEGSANTINSLKINDNFNVSNSGTDGGGLWIKVGADRNIIGNVNMFGQNNTGIATMGILIESNYNNINGGVVSDLLSGTGLKVIGAGNKVNLVIRNCNLGLYYNNSNTSAVKWNTLNLSVFSCTTTEQKDNAYGNESIKLTTNTVTTDTSGALTLNPKPMSSASSYTISDDNSTYFPITLNQNSTFNVPTITQKQGRMIVLRLLQDGTGGWTVAFSTSTNGFKTTYPVPDSAPGTAFKRLSITFIWDGNFWVEQSRTTWM